MTALATQIQSGKWLTHCTECPDYSDGFFFEQREVIIALRQHDRTLHVLGQGPVKVGRCQKGLHDITIPGSRAQHKVLPSVRYPQGRIYWSCIACKTAAMKVTAIARKASRNLQKEQ